MRQVFRLIAIAIIPALADAMIGPAAAQDFQDRWSAAPGANAAQPAEAGQPAEPEPQAPPQAEAPAQPTQSPVANESTTRAMDAYASDRSSIKKTFSGKASFYSYSKGKTASGASFDRDQPTAAHRSLPFGTKVRVINIANNKSVVVTITDRGPTGQGRVLDLSLAAARAIDMTDRGVVAVRAEVL